MEFVKMALNADFLLFIVGIVIGDYSDYIQNMVAACDPNVFKLILATLLYLVIRSFCVK